MSTLLDHPLPTLPPPPPPKLGGRRPRLPNWSKRTWQILAALLAIVFVFGVWLFYFSSVFALESLVVEGVRTVNPTDVGQRADLGAGTPLAQVNPADVEARVMGISAIDSVKVTRRWPHMIVISVVERDRVAALKDGDRWATLDAHGFAFDFTKKKPQGLPVVEAPEGPARTAAIEVAAQLPADVASKIKKVTADRPDNVTLTTSSGVTVAWGSPEQSELKANILRALLAKTKNKWIDVRLPSTPTSAQSSPIPAPPPSPSPSVIAGTEGDQAPSGAIPTVEGVVPSSLSPSPTVAIP
ncbi:MAG: cell division protein FtsQ/DivIB [Candidatus Nanopelagicales bacterium]|jgi:cell division protein FtsQ